MKKGLKIFSLLFAILVLFGLTGCNKKVKEPNKPEEPKENVIKLVSEPKQIEVFDSLISQSKLISDTKASSYSLFNAVVSEDKIIATFNSDKEEEKVTREITSLNNIAGISVSYEKDNGYIYVLTNNGQIYLIELTKTSDIKIRRYEINNVVSFLGFYGDIEGKQVNQPIVLIRTKDNKYYIDYKFSTDSEKVLRQIIAPIQNQEQNVQ